jgi:hypothetical protein
MKKILSLTILFLFIATIQSYAGFFKSQQENENSSENTETLYDNNTNSSGNETLDDYGGFFRSSTADSPGGRPGGGGGVGQEAPLGSGLHVLITCCAVLSIVKIFIKEEKKE